MGTLFTKPQPELGISAEAGGTDENVVFSKSSGQDAPFDETPCFEERIRREMTFKQEAELQSIKTSCGVFQVKQEVIPETGDDPFDLFPSTNEAQKENGYEPFQVKQEIKSEPEDDTMQATSMEAQKENGYEPFQVKQEIKSEPEEDIMQPTSNESEKENGYEPFQVKQEIKSEPEEDIMQLTSNEAEKENGFQWGSLPMPQAVAGSEDDAVTGDAVRGTGEAKVDDDEDPRNPQYIPKWGNFYQHDNLRKDDDGAMVGEMGVLAADTEAGRNPRLWRPDAAETWGHDKFLESEQQPKIKDEVIGAYGYGMPGGAGGIKVEQKDKPFKCSDCEKAFPSNVALKQHNFLLHFAKSPAILPHKMAAKKGNKLFKCFGNHHFESEECVFKTSHLGECDYHKKTSLYLECRGQYCGTQSCGFKTTRHNWAGKMRRHQEASRQQPLQEAHPFTYNHDRQTTDNRGLASPSVPDYFI